MNKMLPISLVLAASALVSTNAMAINTGRTYTVAQDNGLGGSTVVGTWHLLFLGNVAPSGTNFLGACRYLVDWRNSANQSLSQQCILDETKTLGHTVCTNNSRVNFATLVQRAPGTTCRGFDRFQQAVIVNTLILGEAPTASGLVGVGIIQTTGASPAVTGLTVRG